ncbi:MAG: lytic transglycosylase domain-containing protein [Nitrosomonas sp.]|nr:lytic transglycosylase domain-containing protein [Nitrosomonas sp.]
MKRYLTGLLLFLYFGTLSADQGADFIAARKAFQAGNSVLLANYAKHFQNHILADYLDFYQLRLELEDKDVTTIRAFLTKHKNSVMADRLRAEWLKILGKNQQWKLFGEEYPALVNTDIELNCYAYQQRIHAEDPTVLVDARPLWFTADSLPDSCTPVFDTLIYSGRISIDEVWARLRLALEAGQTGVARHINYYIPSHETLNTDQLNAAAQDPLHYLKTQHNKKLSRANREIVLFALLRLLRNDTNQAYAYWLRVENQLTPSDQSYFLGKLAYHATLRHDSRALNWFIRATHSATPYPFTDTMLAWKTRAALRAQNWNIVLNSIESMSASKQQIDTWQYWKARALKAIGVTLEADALFASLSTHHSFYGQLAKEELGTILNIPDQLYEPSATEINAMLQRPEIQRTLAFYKLNLRAEAYREWVWVVRYLNDRELLAASEIARRHGLYERAINAANRTVSQHNFNLRFLAPHRDSMKLALQPHELDEAWVYGLIRQESRFNSDIRSSAGAMGLMQIMPDTAKWVANRLGMRNFRQNLIVDINTNLKMGAYYLKHVLTTFDNQPLLASAAYNAGPVRADQWRDSTHQLEGAIYAETIPFNETRDYVKKVLKNSIYYSKVLEHGRNAPTLKHRLGIVNSK